MDTDGDGDVDLTGGMDVSDLLPGYTIVLCDDDVALDDASCDLATTTDTGQVTLLSVEENRTWTPAAPPAVGADATCVIGPVTAATLAGTYDNTATAHGGYGGSTYDSVPSTAEYTVAAAPSIDIDKEGTWTDDNSDWVTDPTDGDGIAQPGDLEFP